MVELNWKNEGFYFGVNDGKGNEIPLDGNSLKGPSPMNMLLIGLAGCTGSDVLAILEKKKVKQPDTFKISVEGVRKDGEPPKPWTQITVHFEMTGEGLEKDKVVRAIQLSKERYCSVSAMLKHDATINWTLILNGVTIQ